MRYQPGRPLHQLTLGEFHHDLDIAGNSAGDENLMISDPVIPAYLTALADFEAGDALHQTFAHLLSREHAGESPTAATA